MGEPNLDIVIDKPKETRYVPTEASNRVEAILASDVRQDGIYANKFNQIVMIQGAVGSGKSALAEHIHTTVVDQINEQNASSSAIPPVTSLLIAFEYAETAIDPLIDNENVMQVKTPAKWRDFIDMDNLTGDSEYIKWRDSILRNLANFAYQTENPYGSSGDSSELTGWFVHNLIADNTRHHLMLLDGYTDLPGAIQKDLEKWVLSPLTSAESPKTVVLTGRMPQAAKTNLALLAIYNDSRQSRTIKMDEFSSQNEYLALNMFGECIAQSLQITPQESIELARFALSAGASTPLAAVELAKLYKVKGLRLTDDNQFMTINPILIYSVQQELISITDSLLYPPPCNTSFQQIREHLIQLSDYIYRRPEIITEVRAQGKDEHEIIQALTNAGIPGNSEISETYKYLINRGIVSFDQTEGFYVIDPTIKTLIDIFARVT